MRINAVFLTFIFALPGIANAQADYGAEMASNQQAADYIEFLIAIVLWCILGGIVGSVIGGRKGSSGAGFLLGLIFGPIGWILAAVMKGNRIHCAQCRELIDPRASICPRCRAQLVNGRFVPPPSLVASNEFVPPPPRPQVVTDLIRVAHRGEDLGRVSVQSLCEMIECGSLTLQDHFFDDNVKQWLTLDQCPAINIES